MLENQVALVTGASRGIGAAIAQTLAENGAIVIGTATTEAGAAAISDTLATHGGCGMVLDVSDKASIETLIKAIGEKFSAPTILINNAGITKDNLLMRMKEDEWDSVISTNLTSIYRLSKACMRGMMKARHGRIVNIGSVVGLTGNPGQANYAASKAGVLGLTKSLARELGSRNITVNTVAPGFIETDMTNALSEEQRNTLLSGIPLGRLGRPQEIADTVLFLTSPSGGYITGETLHVNGGMYMA
ncbi:MAG: 3-oxoacyl-ACP reductase FabG [Candidatus Polarisedimenticolaceae bacterium]|nr:3-oxoacyl-ACP reductase FabG [Candidatus Polarisedimenticolaceae bacterium]